MFKVYEASQLVKGHPHPHGPQWTSAPEGSHSIPPASLMDSKPATLLTKRVPPPTPNPGSQAMASGIDHPVEDPLPEGGEEATGSSNSSSVPDAGGKTETPSLVTFTE